MGNSAGGAGVFFAETAQEDVPSLSLSQMIAVDRMMAQDLGISLTRMMENAGRCLAELARRAFLVDPRKKNVVVLAGPGGNGGGCLVAARRMQCAGAKVVVFISKGEEFFSPVAKEQLDIVHSMNIPVYRSASLESRAPGQVDLILDGVIGYGLSGDPRGEAAEMIRWANQSEAPVISLDGPSGLNMDDGSALDPCIKANATLTLALPKNGLRLTASKEYVGDLYLGDISVPPELYRQIGITVGNVFALSDIIRLK